MRLVKSRRRELQAASYATHTSHPFSCFSLHLAPFQLQSSSASVFHCDRTLTAAGLARGFLSLIDVAMLVPRDDHEPGVGAVLHAAAKRRDNFHSVEGKTVRRADQCDDVGLQSHELGE